MRFGPWGTGDHSYLRPDRGLYTQIRVRSPDSTAWSFYLTCFKRGIIDSMWFNYAALCITTLPLLTIAVLRSRSGWVNDHYHWLNFAGWLIALFMLYFVVVHGANVSPSFSFKLQQGAFRTTCLKTVAGLFRYDS